MPVTWCTCQNVSEPRGRQLNRTLTGGGTGTELVSLHHTDLVSALKTDFHFQTDTSQVS